MLESTDAVGSSWRRHYERLHLHTPKVVSSLPYYDMPADYPRYPSRQQVVDYLQSYAEHFDIEPRFGVVVTRIERVQDGWRVHASEETFDGDQVIVATGYNRTPYQPQWPGQDDFGGEVLHSREYFNGEPFRGKRVLVVGTGNTGAEICLCLTEHGADAVYLCVRSQVDVIPREFLGIPITQWGITNQLLPLGVQDLITRTVSRVTFGKLEQWGLRPTGKPITRIYKDGRIPLIDVGTVDLIKKGRVQVVGAIERFSADGVVVPQGEVKLDAVILATGYRTGLADLLGDDASTVLDERGIPHRLGRESELPGLFFVGFSNPSTGLIRSIGIDARAAVADLLS